MEFRFKGKRRQVHRPVILPKRVPVPTQHRPTVIVSKPVVNNANHLEKTSNSLNDKKSDYNTNFENKKELPKEEIVTKSLSGDNLKPIDNKEIKSETEKTCIVKDKGNISNENNKMQQKNITQKDVSIKKSEPVKKPESNIKVVPPSSVTSPVKSTTIKNTTVKTPPLASNSTTDPEMLKKLSVLDKEKIKRILQQNESKKQFKKDDLENKVIGLVKNFMTNYEDNINSILSKNFQTNNSVSTTITNTLCEAIDQIQETIPKPQKK